MPQLIEQWRLKSADGIAIGFISIWFLGDLFNLIGAIWANLLPEVIFLAIWFCIADSMMIFSYIYYTRFFPKNHKRTETEPLITRRRSSTLTDIALEPNNYSIFTKYFLPLIIVFGAGIIGYLLSESSNDVSIPEKPDHDIQLGPQIFGYISALLYLGARIPQIIQNHKRKSVEGLSLLFFLFSTLGNITYAGQILFYRSDQKYIMLNLSWILGSIGTIFEDVFIFIQFYIYRDEAVV